MNMRRGVCFKPVLAIHAPGTVFGRVFSRNDNRARIVLCVLYALHLTGIRCQHANRHTRARALNKFACARTVNISPHTVDLFTSASFCVCTHTHNGYSNMLPPSYCAVFAFRPRYMFTYLRGIHTDTHMSSYAPYCESQPFQRSSGGGGTRTRVHQMCEFTIFDARAPAPWTNVLHQFVSHICANMSTQTHRMFAMRCEQKHPPKISSIHVGSVYAGCT